MDYPSKDLSEAQSIVLRDLVTLGLVRVGARVRLRVRLTLTLTLTLG